MEFEQFLQQNIESAAEIADDFDGEIDWAVGYAGQALTSLDTSSIEAVARTAPQSLARLATPEVVDTVEHGIAQSIEQISKLPQQVPQVAALVRENAPAVEQLVRENAPVVTEFVKENAPAVEQFVRANAPVVTEFVRQNAPVVEQYVRENAPAVVAFARENAPAVDRYVRENAPAVVAYARENAPAVERYVRENAPAVVAFAKENAPVVERYVRENAPAVAALIKESAPVVERVVRENAPVVAQIARNSAPAIRETLDRSYTTLRENIPLVLPTVREAVSSVAASKDVQAFANLVAKFETNTPLSARVTELTSKPALQVPLSARVAELAQDVRKTDLATRVETLIQLPVRKLETTISPAREQKTESRTLETPAQLTSLIPASVLRVQKIDKVQFTEPSRNPYIAVDSQPMQFPTKLQPKVEVALSTRIDTRSLSGSLSNSQSKDQSNDRSAEFLPERKLSIIPRITSTSEASPKMATTSFLRVPEIVRQPFEPIAVSTRVPLPEPTSIKSQLGPQDSNAINTNKPIHVTEQGVSTKSLVPPMDMVSVKQLQARSETTVTKEVQVEAVPNIRVARVESPKGAETVIASSPTKYAEAFVSSPPSKHAEVASRVEITRSAEIVSPEAARNVKLQPEDLRVVKAQQDIAGNVKQHIESGRHFEIGRTIEVSGQRIPISRTIVRVVIAPCGSQQASEGATDAAASVKSRYGGSVEFKDKENALPRRLRRHVIRRKGEKRYLTGIEIALAGACLVASVAKSQNPPKSDEAAATAANPQSVLHRAKHIVSAQDSLTRIAEEKYGDRRFAWLLLELNSGAVKQEWSEKQLVVRLKERQEIELPVAQDIEVFRHNLHQFDDLRMITVVESSAFSRELLSLHLGTVIGA